MQPQIKNTLSEVRKAYRFLYEYQRRILDLVSFIGNKYGFTYSGGYPKFSNPTPRRGQGKLTLWAWDWLNLYFYEFHFESKTYQNDKIHFSIFHVSDSGFFDARDENKAEKINISSFNSVENSDSKLIFVVGKNLWDGWGINWDEQDFMSKSSGEKKRNEDSFMIFKHYNLENFINEENAMICIKDFENYCLEKNIDFKIKTNKLKK